VFVHRAVHETVGASPQDQSAGAFKAAAALKDDPEVNTSFEAPNDRDSVGAALPQSGHAFSEPDNDDGVPKICWTFWFGWCCQL
jgi:hypothetical protein